MQRMTLGKSEEEKHNAVLRILLVGGSGHGKSATGNSILGEKRFKSRASAASVTQQCTLQAATRFGKRLEIVDTPGLLDTKRTNEEIELELYRALVLASPGFHAICIVMEKGRFTDHHKRLVDMFFNFFGNDVEKYTFIIFTRIKTNTEFEQFLGLTDTYSCKNDDNSDKNRRDWRAKTDIKRRLFLGKNDTGKLDHKLAELLKRCGGNPMIIDNRGSSECKTEQVQGILEEIERIKNDTGHSYFKNACFNVVHEVIKSKIRFEKVVYSKPRSVRFKSRNHSKVNLPVETVDKCSVVVSSEPSIVNNIRSNKSKTTEDKGKMENEEKCKENETEEKKEKEVHDRRNSENKIDKNICSYLKRLEKDKEPDDGINKDNAGWEPDKEIITQNPVGHAGWKGLEKGGKYETVDINETSEKLEMQKSSNSAGWENAEEFDKEDSVDIAEMQIKNEKYQIYHTDNAGWESTNSGDEGIADGWESDQSSNNTDAESGASQEISDIEDEDRENIQIMLKQSNRPDNENNSYQITKTEAANDDEQLGAIRRIIRRISIKGGNAKRVLRRLLRKMNDT